MQKFIKLIIKKLILFYQRYISVLLGRRCRFYPTCSEYALLVLDKHSLVVSIYKIFIRLIKCNPFYPGGVDLP